MVNAGDVPDSINWLERGAVTSVKDQQHCGSCYAFASTASIESAYFLKSNELVDLSEQNIVDCTSTSSTYGSYGCEGGYSELAYRYVIDNGIARLDAYPYVAKEQTCNSPGGYVWLQSYTHVDPSEDSLKAAVGTIGPISVSIHADPLIFYKSGIFDDQTCPKNLDHEVLMIGYGNTNGQDYWHFKNSWGPKWGENGYCRLARNSDDVCGVALDTIYPVVA